MNEEEIKLLHAVKVKCSEKPSFLQHIINVGVDALVENEREMRHMASDMETFASAMCFLVGQHRVSSKLKEEMSNLALSKLGKYYKKSFINWDSRIVEEKTKK